MAHRSRISKVVVDVTPADHDREIAFWQDVVGRPLVRSDNNPEYHGTPLPGQNFVLLTQRLDDGPSRVHLDIHTDDLDAEVDRLERLGAKRVRRLRNLWIMEDPAGLPFCVIHDAGLTDETSQRWD